EAETGKPGTNPSGSDQETRNHETTVDRHRPVAAGLALAATALADPGGKGKGKGKSRRGKQTFVVTTTDNGSCGTPWATDVVRRTYLVKSNGDGTYTLTRRDRGKFVTLGGTSPGACDTTGRYGHAVRPGVKGRLVGFLRGTV